MKPPAISLTDLDDLDLDQLAAGRPAAAAEAPEPNSSAPWSYRMGWLQQAVKAGMRKPTAELTRLTALAEAEEGKAKFAKPVQRRCEGCRAIFRAASVGEVRCPTCVGTAPAASMLGWLPALRPKPIRFGRRKVWDRTAIDRALDLIANAAGQSPPNETDPFLEALLG